MMRNFISNLMLGLLAVGMLLPTLGGQTNAATILVVSDSAPTGIDAPLVSFLQGLGYTVDTAGMGQTMRIANGGTTSPANAAAIAAADLVLMTRATSSLGYNDPLGWNAVAKPMLLMNPFLIRDSRLGWMSGTGISGVDQTATDLTVTDAAHPYADGVAGTLAGTVPILDWSTSSNPGTADGSADQLLANPADFLPGTELAGILDGKAYAFSIPAGTTTILAGSSSIPFAGPRGFVAAWSYPAGGGQADFGSPFMTANYETLLANAIGALIIPEPSSSLLLMLGATVFGAVRRRNG